MADLTSPDTIVGLGGAGSKVVYHLLSREWFLESLFDVNDEQSRQPDRLDATVIDTAHGETFHEERMADVRATIDQVTERAGVPPETVSVDGPTYLTELLPGPLRENHWTARPIVTELCQAEGLTSWWVDAESKIDRSLTGTGTIRRRSHAKAMYHAARYSGHDIVPYTGQGDDVAVVASLGGGTGSGLALDIAADMPRGRTHLYAILPRVSEPQDLKANAHAALSELEYAFLADECPFDTVTLLPLPEVEENNLRMFDRAAVRTILSHQARVQSGAAPVPGTPEGPPVYAPFSMGVPFTLEYDLDAVDRARERVEASIEALEGDLELEQALYDRVWAYLNTSFSDSFGPPEVREADRVPTGPRGEAALRDLVERVERLQGPFLNQEAFEIVGLGPDVAEIRSKLEEVDEELADTDPETITDQWSYLQTAVDLMISQVNYRVHETETTRLGESLWRVVEAELRAIGRRRDLLAAVAELTPERTALTDEEADTIREALYVLLDTEETLLGSDVPITEMIAERETTADRLEATLDDLEAFHEKVVTRLRDHFDEWMTDHQGAFETIAAATACQAPLEVAVDELKDTLEVVARSVEQAEDVDLLRGGHDLDVDLPNERLEELGIDPIDINRVRQAIASLEDAKRAHLRHNPSPVPGLGTDASEAFQSAVSGLQSTELFEIQPGQPRIDVEKPFAVAVDPSVIQRREALEERRRDAIDELVESFAERLFDRRRSPQFEWTGQDGTIILVPDEAELEDAQERLRATLADSDATTVADLQETLTTVVTLDETLPATSRPRLPSDDVIGAYVDPIRTHYDELTDRYERLVGEGHDSGVIHAMAQLQALAGGDAELESDQVTVARSEGAPNEKTGRALVSDYDPSYEVEVEPTGPAGDDPYVERLAADPSDVTDPSSLRDVGDMAVLESRTAQISTQFKAAIQRLVRNKRELAPVCDIAPGITVPAVTDDHEDGEKADAERRAYSGPEITTVLRSRAFREGSADDIARTVVDAVKDVEPNANVLEPRTYGFGDPSELTAVTFLDGLFLDNLGPMGDRRGYEQSYPSHEGAEDPTTRHHSIGLGGAWDRWSTLGEWVEASAEADGVSDDQGVGGYVYRDEVRPVDRELISDLNRAARDDDADPRALFVEALSVEAFESTVGID
jgi:hypothetical protein